MATFIVNEEDSSEVSAQVPVVSNVPVTLKVKEYKYEKTKANDHWCILLKVEILSANGQDTIKVAGKGEVKEYSIAGQDFTTRIMLEGKKDGAGVMPKGSVKALKSLEIDPTTLDVEDANTLTGFHGLEFKASINGKGMIKQQLNPNTGLQENAKDDNGNDIIAGAKWEFAPWDIIGLA